MVQLVARWTTDHYHLSLNLGVAYLKGVSSLTSLHYIWRSLDPFSLPCVQKWPQNIINQSSSSLSSSIQFIYYAYVCVCVCISEFLKILGEYLSVNLFYIFPVLNHIKRNSIFVLLSLTFCIFNGIALQHDIKILGILHRHISISSLINLYKWMSLNRLMHVNRQSMFIKILLINE